MSGWETIPTRFGYWQNGSRIISDSLFSDAKTRHSTLKGCLLASSKPLPDHRHNKIVCAPLNTVSKISGPSSQPSLPLWRAGPCVVLCVALGTAECKVPGVELGLSSTLTGPGSHSPQAFFETSSAGSLCHKAVILILILLNFFCLCSCPFLLLFHLLQYSGY